MSLVFQVPAGVQKFRLVCKKCNRGFHSNGHSIETSLHAKDGPYCPDCLPGTCYYCGMQVTTIMEGKKICGDCYEVFGGIKV